MNTTKLKLTIVGICGLILVPTSVFAGSATLINDNSVLFTIDFSFTDELFDLKVPIAAEYGVTYLDRVDTVGYTVESEEAEGPKITDINALVLSTTQIEDGKYNLEAGSTGDFTLVILATFAEALTQDYRAYITKLPYFIDERRTTVHQNQLDDLEVPVLEVE